MTTVTNPRTDAAARERVYAFADRLEKLSQRRGRGPYQLKNGLCGYANQLFVGALRFRERVRHPRIDNAGAPRGAGHPRQPFFRGPGK